jgi:hypothetical protein
MSREEFLVVSPRELDALLRHKYDGEARRLACLRADIWNAALMQAGSDKRIEPEEFLGSGATAKDDMRRFIEECERGQIAQPSTDELGAFKGRIRKTATAEGALESLRKQHTRAKVSVANGKHPRTTRSQSPS